MGLNPNLFAYSTEIMQPRTVNMFFGHKWLDIEIVRQLFQNCMQIWIKKSLNSRAQKLLYGIRKKVK